MVSPSGNHANPWEFVVVRDREKLSRLGVPKNQGKYFSAFTKQAEGYVS